MKASCGYGAPEVPFQYCLQYFLVAFNFFGSSSISNFFSRLFSRLLLNRFSTRWLTIYIEMAENDVHDHLIKEYFHIGFSYKEIIDHEIRRSIRQLKRFLARSSLGEVFARRELTVFCAHWPLVWAITSMYHIYIKNNTRPIWKAILYSIIKRE